MENKCSNTTVAVITAVITAVLVAVIMSSRQPAPVQDEFADWIPYETSQGLVFSYPPGYGVTENTDPEDPDVTNYFVVGLEHDDTIRQHPPVLQINASDSMVSLALWEGIPWEGYPQILETLKWQ